MYSARVKAVEGSVLLELPAEVLAELSLQEGEPVSVRVEHGTLTLSPRLRNVPTLEEMLAECDFSIPPSAEEVEWEQAPPVGREII